MFHGYWSTLLHHRRYHHHHQAPRFAVPKALPWTNHPKVQESDAITQIDSISNPALYALAMEIQPEGRTEWSQVDPSKVGHDRGQLF